MMSRLTSSTALRSKGVPGAVGVGQVFYTCNDRFQLCLLPFRVHGQRLDIWRRAHSSTVIAVQGRSMPCRFSRRSSSTVSGTVQAQGLQLLHLGEHLSGRAVHGHHARRS